MSVEPRLYEAGRLARRTYFESVIATDPYRDPWDDLGDEGRRPWIELARAFAMCKWAMSGPLTLVDVR